MFLRLILLLGVLLPCLATAQSKPYLFHAGIGAFAGRDKIFGNLSGEIHFGKSMIGLQVAQPTPATSEKAALAIFSFPPAFHYITNPTGGTISLSFRSYEMQHGSLPMASVVYAYFPGNKFTLKGLNKGLFLGCGFSAWRMRATFKSYYSTDNNAYMDTVISRQNGWIFTGGMYAAWRIFIGRKLTTDLKLNFPFYYPVPQQERGSFTGTHPEIGINLGMRF